MGKMGGGIARRLVRAGHEVVVFDRAAEVARSVPATRVESFIELSAALRPRRVIWLMLPAGEAVTDALTTLGPHLGSGDIVIDGGNSYYEHSVARAFDLAGSGVSFLDIGVSGGVAGEEQGYALMIGGELSAYEYIRPVVLSLSAPSGYMHVGPAGAGHYVKMVHNSIEYGMMQAIGEGFALLHDGPFKNMSLAAVARVWNNGTIIRSFLMELTARALASPHDLKDVAPYVADSGEGRWSVETAVRYGVPLWVTTAALYARFASQQRGDFSDKLLAALRKEFGGHSVKKT